MYQIVNGVTSGVGMRSTYLVFIVTPSEIFGHLGHMNTLTIKKMALPSMYRWRWCHILAFFIETNTIALGLQRFTAGANMICLLYASDWRGVIGPVIHSESKSQATRSSPHHIGLLHTLSTIDTQGASCIGGLGQTDGENLSWEFLKVRVHLVL